MRSHALEIAAGHQVRGPQARNQSAKSRATVRSSCTPAARVIVDSLTAGVAGDRARVAIPARYALWARELGSTAHCRA